MVMALEPSSAHSCGITVLYCVAEYLSVEALQVFGGNVVSLQLEMGDLRWYIVGCYLAPYNALKIDHCHPWKCQRVKQGTSIFRQPWPMQGSKTWADTSSIGKFFCWRTAGHGACAAEDRRCDPGPTTSWAQKVVCYRTWWSRNNGTKRIINCSWVDSAEPRLPRTCATLGSGHASSSSVWRPWTRLTACSMRFEGLLQIHLGGNTSVRCGFYWKPDVSSILGLWHANARTSGAPGHSSVLLRQFSRWTGAKEQPRRGMQWSPSSHPIRLLFDGHGSGWGDGTSMQWHPPPPPPAIVATTTMTIERVEL